MTFAGKAAGPPSPVRYAQVGGGGRSLRALRAGSKDITKSQLFLDPFLRCTHGAIIALVEGMVGVSSGPGVWRARRRREADLGALCEQTLIVISNAAYALALGLEPPTVAIALGRPSRKRMVRYEGPALGQLRAVLEAVSPGLATVTPSRRKGVASVLKPGADLMRTVANLPSFGVDSFRRVGVETIVVRRVERSPETRKRLGAVNVDYADTEETRRMRAEMERINIALESADISLAGGWEPGSRQLYRTFNTESDAPSFAFNGRLQGGWWEQLPREQRWDIRIDGERVADLDYRNMHLRLAYTTKGLEPPPGDLYAEILAMPEDDARYRVGVKQFVNALLNRDGDLKRRPRGSAQDLPDGVTAAALRVGVMRRHAPIADLFEVDAGRRLMRRESDILVAVLLRLIDKSITALPMHDGLLVRGDHAEVAAAAMAEVSREMTGHVLEVKCSTGASDG